jgi:hypothetical protein
MSLSIETDVSILFNQNSIAPGFSDEDGKEKKTKNTHRLFLLLYPSEREREKNMVDFIYNN